MALAERMLAERFNRDGPRDRRSLHVRDRVRRRPAGGRRLRGLLAGRPPRPRPADLVLGRQPHLDRGRHRALVHRGRRRALRGLRLARAEPRRGHRPGPHRGGAGQRPRRHRPAEHDRRPHAHRARARRTSRTRTRRTARRSATRRSSSPRRSTAGPSLEPFFVPDEALEHFRACDRRAARRLEAEWRERFEAYRGEFPEPRPRSSSACSSRKLPEGWDADVPDEGPRTTA